MAKTALYAAVLLVAALVLAASPATTVAQAPAEAPIAFPIMAPVEGPAGAFPMAPSSSGSDDCFSALLNMSDCLDYVQAGSNLTAPEKGCCPELAGLVESQPICLCQLLSDPEKIVGQKIELNKALKLPSVCKISTPSATLCAAIGIPVGAPTPSSEGPTPSSGIADASSPAGFASSPTGGKGDSAAPRLGVFYQWQFLVCLAAMVFANLF